VNRSQNQGPPEPRGFATFDLDVALALLARMSADFGARVTDMDVGPEGMRYVVDVPTWGRALARGTERAVRNEARIRRVKERTDGVHRFVLLNRAGVSATREHLQSLRERRPGAS